MSAKLIFGGLVAFVLWLFLRGDGGGDGTVAAAPDGGPMGGGGGGGGSGVGDVVASRTYSAAPIVVGDIAVAPPGGGAPAAPDIPLTPPSSVVASAPVRIESTAFSTRLPVKFGAGGSKMVTGAAPILAAAAAPPPGRVAGPPPPELWAGKGMVRSAGANAGGGGGLRILDAPVATRAAAVAGLRTPVARTIAAPAPRVAPSVVAAKGGGKGGFTF